ncbi:MAG: prephenate dehydrogenase [Anaerolineae bacterium]|jgi:prephenate dehydrogenase|nr:prephenate dehydrogenase [Anaerolineae bacterium]
MSIQITIIGLGQIGASIGLALAEHKKIVRIGHDKNMTSAKIAQRMGAVDKVKRNLPNSVRDADIIILSLPFSEIRETLGYIKEDLKEGAVILDTAPSKAATSEWMQELLPAGHSYIGLAPVINPFYLDEKEFGVNAARADLFNKAVTMIAASPTASGKAMQLASDLVKLFGSTPLFADIAEVDGVMASSYLLPQLVAAALLNTTVDAPGWGEARKFAGKAYANTTEASPQEEGTASLSAAALSNEANITRALDWMIASLQDIQKNIAEGDEDGLNELLSRAEDGHENWLIERRAAEWILRGEKADSVKLGGIAERFFGFKERK